MPTGGVSTPSQDLHLFAVVDKARGTLLKSTSVDSQQISTSTSQIHEKKKISIIHVVHTTCFECVVAVAIVANAVFLGFKCKMLTRSA